MSNKEQRKAPVLRFKGFTDDWEQRKWKDILLVNSGKDYKHLSRGSIPVYGTGGYMLSVDKELSNVDAIGIGRKGTIDHPQYLKAPFWTVDTLFFMTPKNDINIDFAFGLSQTINWKKYDESTGLPSLSKKSIDNISIKLPNYNEQIKIGRIISQIDNVISLQQRKLDELIQIKEGIGQGLLNRHYRNLSIRFNRENSPWKQTKLGKIASFVNGRAFKQKELMNRGLYPVLRVGNFYTNNKWYYSNLNLSSDKYANKGDLLYTWSASFGPHVWKGPKVIYHYHIWKINFDPAVISKAYLYEFLKLDKKEILANSNGSTMIHITKKDMENKMITVPDMNEQIKIGKILEKLDLKIELNKNKLNNLKSVKQFLLQKMFM